MTECDMGNGAEFLKGIALGGARSEYEAIGPAKTVGGIKGKVLRRAGGSDTHSNLPYYAATSDMYFRRNHSGVCQGRVYLEHKLCIDFDWSHVHVNKGTDGRRFDIGVVHVQIWRQNQDGSFTRVSNGARNMSNAEMKKYGPLIKAFCPDVKFR